MGGSSGCDHWMWKWVVDKFYHYYTEVSLYLYLAASSILPVQFLCNGFSILVFAVYPISSKNLAG